MKYYHVMQHDTTDCGAACFCMISRYYGYKITIAKARKLVNTDKFGTNIYGITSGAEKIGFESYGLEGDYKELIDGINNNDFKFPFIARILNEDDYEHYIVVYNITKKHVVIGDPAKSRITKITIEEFNKRWLNDIIVFNTTESFKKGNETKGLFLKYFSYLKEQPKITISIILLSIIITLINLVGTFSFEYIINSKLNDESKGFFELIFDNAWILALSLIGLYLLASILSFLKSFILIKLSKKITLSLSRKLYGHLIDSKPYYLKLFHTGELLTRFYDMERIIDVIPILFFSSVMDIIMAIFSFAVLLYLSPILSIIAIVILILHIINFFAFKKKINIESNDLMANDGRTFSKIKEYIDGSNTIKSYSYENNSKDNVSNLYNKYEKNRAKKDLYSEAQDKTTILISIIGTVLVLFLGYKLSNDGIIAIGTIITFYYLMNYFLNPVEKLTTLQPRLQDALVASDRLNDIFELDNEKYEAGKKLDNISNIEIKDLYFRYGSRELVLNGINMNIPYGKKIAIVGESGCGKTTIARLLMRFNEYEDGDILINGISIRDYNINSIREKIAYIDQETFLISESVYDNIRMNSNISNEEIEQICKECMCDEFISEMPNSYDTVLEENGRNLSGGQKQRISIARALAHKPALLIMDEATSNLDTITEKGISTALDKLNITCIIIAHRLKTIKRCDYIYVLNKGKVIEEGTHDSLMEKDGLYANYWK